MLGLKLFIKGQKGIANVKLSLHLPFICVETSTVPLLANYFLNNLLVILHVALF